MTPTVCQVKHDPPNTYGDCLRACICTIFDLDPPAVPHFAWDNPDGDTLIARLRAYLAGRSMQPMWVMFSGSQSDVLDHMGEVNGGVTYLLFNDKHVVVCKGGKVGHDPAWDARPMSEPADGV